MMKLRRIVQLLVTVGMVSVFPGCAATQKHASTGQDGTDSAITFRVKASIFDEASLNTLPIKVRTFNSVVQLSGFVDSAQSVTRAGEVAGLIEGVMAVNNELALNY